MAALVVRWPASTLMGRELQTSVCAGLYRSSVDGQLKTRVKYLNQGSVFWDLSIKRTEADSTQGTKRVTRRYA